jgi:hypothetical protein
MKSALSWHRWSVRGTLRVKKTRTQAQVPESDESGDLSRSLKL